MSDRWGRYAPSPSGPQHLGNLQTALGAWLQTRVCGGGFILRIEDLDLDRSHPQHSSKIIEDLRWLGLNWDVGPGAGDVSDYLQSHRSAHYHAALEHLRNADLLYPCTCSRRDIRTIASAPHGPLGTVYPGICSGNALPPQFRWQSEVDHPAAVRFRSGTGRQSFVDVVQGQFTCDIAREVGDFVVFRRDGLVAYHLAVVVDDIAMNVTDVVRGGDLIASVFPQSCLYQALGMRPPRYWHLPLRMDESGERLSKRDGAQSLATLIDSGMSPEQVIGILASGLGLIDRELPISLAELVCDLDESRLIEAFRSTCPDNKYASQFRDEADQEL
ncbi:MAG: glutamyl-Q tRNA(Asp) synthetase [marine bacterium B5-7]|nr:MAG: glutamyl-Q tRNA(Asp) synthetase [marine bacterium B5-7]